MNNYVATTLIPLAVLTMLMMAVSLYFNRWHWLVAGVLILCVVLFGFFVFTL